MKVKNKNITFFLKALLLLGIIMMSSCQATRYLQDGQKFLHKNRIIFDSPEKIENKFLLKEELEALILLKPSESLLWVPRYWFYYYAKDKKGGFFRALKKQIAQYPPIFSEEKVKLTAKNIEKFLRNKKGFYNAKVEYKIYEDKYLVDVDYIIHTGRRYRIKSVDYACKDKGILKLVKANARYSYLRPGDGVDYLNFDLEKARIKNLLQNNGYALFKQDLIELYGDSANYKIDLLVEITMPQDSNIFKIYKINKIDVFTDYYPGQDEEKLTSTTLGDIKYYRELDDFLIKPEVLSAAITLHRNDIYSKQKDRDIYKKLSQFNIYKFITIKTEVDSTKSGMLNYRIYLFPHEYKYYPEENIDLKYVTLASKKKYINFSLNGSLDDRKLSNAGDFLSISGSSDIKMNIANKKFSETNFLGRMEYNNPYAPFTIKASPLYLVYLLSNNRHKNLSYLRNNTLTQVSLSYNYRTLKDYYNISSFNLDYRHNFIPNKKLNIVVSQAAINYYAPHILKDSILITEYQRKSFTSVFSTGLFLKYFSYNYKYAPKNKLWSYLLVLGVELSGTEIYLANKLYNKITGGSGYWKFNDNIGYAKFIKSHFEITPQYKLTSNSLLAGRFFAGIGVPFGDTEVMPYNKQFEVGGPNSMRAWASRELGPGSYHNDTLTEEIPYQKGDIRLEANLEYRFKLSYFFKSAIFVDAGNIWTLKYDVKRAGSQFTRDFYKQIAVDAGFSLQLDVYVLLRLDFAFKLRNPYPDKYGSYWNPRFYEPTFVFAIDHPF